MSEAADPIAVANLTGFPLQLALEAITRAHDREYNWYVLSREHFCPPSAETPYLFIDLVVSGTRQSQHDGTYYRCILVIECKRLDSDWVFLEPREDRPFTSPGVDLLTTVPSAGALQHPTHPWCRVQFGPTSEQSAFCALSTRRGAQAGQPDRRTLEGWCRELLTSTVALARQSASSFVDLGSLGSDRPRSPSIAVFMPVIVTTARLSILSFDPGAVPLATGTVPPPPASVSREVSSIWFAKDFGFEPEASDPLAPSFRTPPSQGVLVVHATAFAEFLRQSQGIHVRARET